MNSIQFEMEMIPVYNKIEITQNVGFPISPFDEYSQYETLYDYIYLGIIYQFLLKVENKDILSYDEFLDLCDDFISSRMFDGVKTVSYGKTDILTATSYSEDDGSVITPVYGSNINKLNKPTNIKEKKEDREKALDIIAKSKDFHGI